MGKFGRSGFEVKCSGAAEEKEGFVDGLGFRVYRGLGFRVYRGLGFRVKPLKL